MPIYSPTGFLDITNATLRTSNLEAQNFKLNGGNIYVTSELTTNELLNLDNVVNAGNATSNTVQFTNTTTGFVVDSNIVVTGNVTAGSFLGDGSGLTSIPPSAITGTLSQWSDGTNSDVYIASNVGIGNVHTLTSNTLQVGANLYVRDADANVLTVTGNVAADYFEGDGSKLTGISSTLQAITDSGNVTSNTVQFTNTTTGFVTTSNIEVGGALKINTITAAAYHALSAVTAVGASTGDTIQLTNATTGLVTTANVDVGGDMNVTGNLTVLGTKTIVDTDTLRVKDPIIELGKDNPGTGDLGLVMTRPSGSSNVAMIFDESTDTLEIGYTQSNASDTDITMESTPLSVNVNGDLSVTSNLEVGTANLFVDTVNSRVGIGTTNPDNALHIRSAIPAVLLDDSDDDTKVRITGGAGGDLYVDSNWGGSGNTGDIIFREASSEKMRIAGNGNVGITPRPPKARLQVGNLLTTSYSDRETIPQSNMGINTDFPSTTHAWFANRTSDSQEDYWGLAIGTKYSGDSYIQTVHKNATIVFDLLLQPNGGNVGIGTTSPDYLLDVQSTSDAADKTMARLYSSANATGVSSTGLIFEKGTGYGGAIKGFISQGVGSGLSLHTLNGGTDAQAMTIMNSGGVGIGTTTPRTNLHIGQQLNSQGDKNTIPAAGLGISADFPSSTHAWFAHRVNATGDEYWGLAVGTIYDGASYLQNLNKNSGTYYNLLLQPNGGNVGIGTTTAESSLEVHGTGIHINGTVLRSYSGIGAMTAGTWYKVCDFSALPATVSGVCAIRIKWGGGTLTNVGTYYWTGYASGIVPYNTYSDGNGTYNAAPSEPLTLTQHYHHRAAGAFEFILDSDNSGSSSYGRQSIYIKTPQSLSALSLEVIAMPLRR